MLITNNQFYIHNFRGNQNPSKTPNQQKPQKEISKTEDLLLKTNPMTAPIYVGTQVLNGNMKAGESVSSIAASLNPLYSVYYVTQQAKKDDEITKSDAVKILALNTITNAAD